jgi:hypothetical protein
VANLYAIAARHIEDLPKALDLLERIALVRFVRAREVAHDPAHREAGKLPTSVQECRRLIGSNADPAHAGIDLEMDRDAASIPFRRTRQRLRHIHRAYGGFAAVGHNRLGMLWQRR